MFKKVLLTLIGLMLLMAAAAQAEPHLFVPLHWVVGQVTASDGASVANREVIFYKDGKMMTAISARTDSAGRYVINTYNNKDLTIDLSQPGDYRVAVLNDPADNYGAEPVPVTATDGYWTASLVLTLGGGPRTTGTVTGTITDKVTGQPIANAVALLTTNLGERASAPTGPDGIYLIERLEAGTYQLKATASGYQVSEGETIGVAVNQTTTKDFALVPLPAGTAQVYGVVTDEAGNRLSRVRIKVGEVETYTGTYGDYSLTLSLAQAANYDVIASSDNYTPVTKKIFLAPGDARELNFRLALINPANSGTVEGWVKNREGEGISGAFTIIGDKGYSTNFVGFYQISKVEPGTYTVYAQAQGYKDGFVANIVVKAGETTAVPDIILDRLDPNEAALTGLVIAGDTGRPLAGARVKAGSLSALTNADGRYSLTVAPATYTLRATAEGYIPEEKAVTLAGGEMQNIDFILWREKGPTTAGVIDLNISRVGSDIRIELLSQPEGGVQIYLLTGEGYGVYQDRYAADKWEEVKAGSPSYNEFVFNDKLITHKGQVGRGYGEAYYKVLQAGIDLSTAVGAATFEAAPAVGKINVKIAGGKNSLTVISSPFADPPQELTEFFGGQLSYPKGADEKADSVRVLGWSNGAWNRTSYFDGGTIKPLADENSRAIYTENQGIMIHTRNVNAPEKTLTLVGKVKPLTAPTAYSIRPDLNLLGAPYPLLLRLDQINLSGGAKGSRETADRIYGWANGAWNRTSYLDNDGQWQPLAAGMGVEKMPAGLPSLYRSKKGSVWNWELKPENN